MKKIFAVLSLLMFQQLAFAQAVPVLMVPSDSRSMAMGGIDMQRDADNMDIQAFYGMWAPKSADNKMFGGNAFFRIGKDLGVSLEGRVFKDKPYDIISEQGMATGESFSPSDKIFGAGVFYDITEVFSVGLKGRVVASAIAADAKGSAFCADLSAAYNGDVFSATLALRNVGSKISYGKASYSLPSMAALQGSVRPLEGLTAAAEIDYLLAGRLMAALGVEYGIADIVFLRAGYHYCSSVKGIPTYASLGLGLQFAGVRLEASYLTASKTLDNTLLFSLGYAF